MIFIRYGITHIYISEEEAKNLQKGESVEVIVTPYIANSKKIVLHIKREKDEEEGWLDVHPVSKWMLNKLSDFLWFFAKFSVCVLICKLIFILS